MATASFLLSTGRTSTQNIASIARAARPDAVIEHEPLAGNYYSRRVFRRPRKFHTVFGAQISIQRKFIEIEDTLAQGTDYVDVGWPVYAWLPYLQDRLGEQFRFVHLVRNPFRVAASLMTHGRFSTDQPGKHRYQRRGMIHVGDAGTKFVIPPEVNARLSPFERNLFHWLEVNAFALDLHGSPGFRGLYRFEDLYASQNPQIVPLLTDLIGPGPYDLSQAPVDQAHATRSVRIGSVDPDLLRAVVSISEQLGYDRAQIEASFDAAALESVYAGDRLRKA